MTEKVLLANYDDPKPIPWFHMLLWEHHCAPQRHAAIAAPRGFAKSTAVTHACTLTEVCFRTTSFTVIMSDTEAQAINFLTDIKSELLENEILHAMFGVPLFEKDNESDCIIRWPDGFRQRIIARSSMQKLRGLKWDNKRPDLFIGDDMENDEIVMNDERRLKFKRWIYGAVLPAGSRKARFRFVGTILHMDSFLMGLMPAAGDPATKHEALKMWSTKLVNGWYSVLFRAHPGIGDYSELLWPERFSQAELEAEYSNYKAQGLSAQYASEYLNHPIDPSEAYFREGDLKSIPNAIKELPPPQTYYMYCDLAISEASGAAWTVLLVAGVDNVGMVRVWDVIRFRGAANVIVEELVDAYIKWRPDTVYIERENIARSIGPFLDQEIQRKGLNMNINSSIVPTKDKIARSRSIQGRIRQGTIEFDTEAHWWHTLRAELTTFPRSQYKDQVDALSLLGLTLSNMVPGMVEMQEQEPYMDDTDNPLDGDFDLFNQPSSITGY